MAIMKKLDANKSPGNVAPALLIAVAGTYEPPTAVQVRETFRKPKYDYLDLDLID
jgi:hypothetical protein